MIRKISQIIINLSSFCVRDILRYYRSGQITQGSAISLWRLSLCQRHTCRLGDTDLNWVLHYSKTYRARRAKKCQSDGLRKIRGGDTLTQYPAQQAGVLTYKWNRQATRGLINMEILSVRNNHREIHLFFFQSSCYSQERIRLHLRKCIKLFVLSHATPKLRRDSAKNLNYIRKIIISEIMQNIL